tara:strand:+ start:1255 stop:1626 length:372 start_codon:yes stop_codon:yes gene_type:complete
MKDISIDFDGTLELIEVQDYVQTLMNRNDVRVWVTTRRFGNKPGRNNNDLYKVTRKLGIPNDRITFCNFKWKFEEISDKKFIFHLDDDSVDLDLLDRGSNHKIKCIQYTKNGNWRGYCEKFLK